VILDTVEELILIAAGRSDANFEEQVFVLQRKQGCDPHALSCWRPLAFGSKELSLKGNIGVIREYFESLIKVFLALGRIKRRLFHQYGSYQWNGRGAMGYTTLGGITTRNGATGFNASRGRGRRLRRSRGIGIRVRTKLLEEDCDYKTIDSSASLPDGTSGRCKQQKWNECACLASY
jgi:hypothetical protein